jgi:hypothetical protein
MNIPFTVYLSVCFTGCMHVFYHANTLLPYEHTFILWSLTIRFKISSFRSFQNSREPVNARASVSLLSAARTLKGARPNNIEKK